MVFGTFGIRNEMLSMQLLDGLQFAEAEICRALVYI
jgi:hypothetical protein